MGAGRPESWVNVIRVGDPSPSTDFRFKVVNTGATFALSYTATAFIGGGTTAACIDNSGTLVRC